MNIPLSRRNFLKGTSAAAWTAAFGASPDDPSLSVAPGPYRGKVCFFSKALPAMEWRRLAQSTKRLGFDGIDLTVRRGGHVLPERAAQDLPRAVEAIRAEGMEVPMITTELTSVQSPAARNILSAAGELKIPFFKPGYYQYEFLDVRKELERVGKDFRGLAELAKQNGVQVGFHNHEGYVGAAVWDIATFIEPMEPKWVGYYFDVRHATAEGGVGGWKIATNLVAPRLKMAAVKDFYWEKTSKGWRDSNCPLGEGMVDWKSYFRALARAGFHGPISVHLEYEIAGSSPGVKEEDTLAAGRRDLEFVRAGLREAYGAS